jgi:hypothetical protein
VADHARHLERVVSAALEVRPLAQVGAGRDLDELRAVRAGFGDRIGPLERDGDGRTVEDQGAESAGAADGDSDQLALALPVAGP